jgi:hypothetical protein
VQELANLKGSSWSKGISWSRKADERKEASMKVFLSRITVPIIILALVTAGCGRQIIQPTPDPTSPPVIETTQQKASEIIEAMVERMNAGDVEGSLVYFADDAVAYVIGLPPTGMEVYAGKEQIRALWQDSVANHFQWETEVTSAGGDIVNVKAKTWHDFTRQLGVAPLEYIDVYEVKDGKIITYGTTITAEALARFMPAFDEVVPAEEPVPSTEPPISEMKITIAGGTCTIDNPAPLQAGEIKVTLSIEDQNKDLYALTMFNLDADKDMLDLMTSTTGMPPSWTNILLMEEQKPGTNNSYTFTVEKGPVYMICWSKPPDLPIGNAGPIEVSQ